MDEPTVALSGVREIIFDCCTGGGAEVDPELEGVRDSAGAPPR